MEEMKSMKEKSQCVHEGDEISNHRIIKSPNQAYSLDHTLSINPSHIHPYSHTLCNKHPTKTKKNLINNTSRLIPRR